MSSLFGIGAGSASTGFYNGVIASSLRFDRASSSYLIQQNSTATDSQKWTLSVWLKRSTLGAEAGILGASTTAEYVRFESNDTIRYRLYTSAAQRISMITNAVFRDTTNFFHFVCAVDLSNTTDNDKVIMYANGTRLSLGTNTTTSTDTYDSLMNANSAYWNLGRYSNYYGGYMSDVHIIDGQQLTPSSFAETKNGVWIAKEYTGTYGNNGARLEFKGTGTSTSTGTVSTPTNIGDDSSGNNNHFDANNVSAHDSNMPDSPENNFATLNILQQRSNSSATFSEGNLKAVGASASASGIFTGTFGVSSGKWYWEVRATGSAQYLNTGIVRTPFDPTSTGDSGILSNEYVYINNGNKYNNNSSASYGASYTSGDIIGVALDLDADTLTFYKNGSSQGVAYSSLPSGTYLPVFDCYNSSSWILNAGQEGTFVGNETAQGNSDAKGIGDFYYSTNGHLALCSSNLPDTTISPNQDTQADDHFNTITWTGTGNGADAKTVGFQPDFIWGKDRQYANNHNLFDSSRGIQQRLSSSETSAESTETDIFQSFDSNGFTTIGQGLNFSNVNYVAWNWKAGGSTPSKTYKVVVVSDSGNKFRFRNSADSATFAQSAVTLNLQELGTYTFDVSDSSMSGHALKFSTTSDGIHGGGSEYTTGVTSSGTSGQTGAYVQITVASSAPTLYYYCGISGHSGMGGQVNTNSTHGSTNFDGSILSVVQTNETSGFSIVTYTGTGSEGTVAHGLSSAPEVLFIKNRTDARSWVVGHVSGGFTGQYTLNTNGAFSTNAGSFNDTAPTSTVVNVNTDQTTNESGDSMVMYCFHSVEGYSKFGKFIGNNLLDGSFIYTGFRPAWILAKRSDSTSDWFLLDNKRSPHNVVGGGGIGQLASNQAYAESSLSTYAVADFLSNGFKLRHDMNYGYWNASGGTYIYLAFAEQPFKFSNAR